MSVTEHLDLSTGFFNLEAGRRHDSADTLRVLPALDRDHGRSTGLYAVCEASTVGTMGSRARRLVLEVVQGDYSNRLELAPAPRLKRAIEAAHGVLLSEFHGHVRVGLSVLVAEDHDVFLAQVPPARAYVLHEESVHSVTADGADATDTFQRSLGSPHGPSISVFKDRVQETDLIALCTTELGREIAEGSMEKIFSIDEPKGIASRLYDHSRRQGTKDATLVVLQAVASPSETEPASRGDEEQAPSLWDQLDDALASIGYVWDWALSELKGAPVGGRHHQPQLEPRTPNGSEDSIRDLDHAARSDEPQVVDLYAQSPLAGATHSLGDEVTEYGTEEVPLASSTAAGSVEIDDYRESFQEAGTEARFGVEEVGLSSTASSDLDEVNRRIHDTLGLGDASPSLESFPDAEVTPRRVYPGPGRAPSGRRKGFVELGGLEADHGRTGAPAVPASRQRRRRGVNLRLASVPSAMWLWSAAGLVIVIAAIILVIAVGTSGVSAATYLQRARTHVGVALASRNSAAQHRQLALARDDIVLARKHGATPAQVRVARRSVQQAVYRIERIIQVASVSRVMSFLKPLANPTQIAPGPAQGVYVLDSGLKDIYYVNTAHRNHVSRLAHPGDVFPPGTTNISWHDPTELTSSAGELVALDNRYDLLVWTPSTSPGYMEQVQPPPDPSGIVATTTFSGNLYGLDPILGQVWRYWGNGSGGFGIYPSTYLRVRHPRLLRKATSIAVDGDVYIGTSAGRILKFSAGRLAPFRLFHIPFAGLRITQIYTRRDLPILYVLDAPSRQLVEFTKQGSYLRTVRLGRSINPGLRSMTVSLNGRSVYVLAGRTIYRLPSLP